MDNIENAVAFTVEQSLLLALIEKMEAAEPGSTARLQERALELVDSEPFDVSVPPDMAQVIRDRAREALPIFLKEWRIAK